MKESEAAEKPPIGLTPTQPRKRADGEAGNTPTQPYTHAAEAGSRRRRSSEAAENLRKRKAEAWHGPARAKLESDLRGLSQTGCAAEAKIDVKSEPGPRRVKN
ncbi:uncharacterized protein LOC117191856 [Drosophila miranda]|uniref:uncharacterized protein LOC117191856 n=1 Tax=Drosophila miranda TaxID=7229 RepID=UPI00143F996C|nr:uncharacterized protein LOC117191856 [Drosophila miranda]